MTQYRQQLVDALWQQVYLVEVAIWPQCDVSSIGGRHEHDRHLSRHLSLANLKTVVLATIYDYLYAVNPQMIFGLLSLLFVDNPQSRLAKRSAWRSYLV